VRPIDEYFLQKEEPIKSCLQALRAYLLQLDPNIAETWKYGMPFYTYNGAMFCYLWVHKKFKQPYIGIVADSRINHPDLLLEKRAKMKILLIDPEQDIPIDKINGILQAALKFYRQG